MSVSVFVGSAQRTFRSAIVHLLETEYGLLGSRRVLDLLACDVQTLAEQFYPRPTHLASGWLVLTGTKASGSKAYPGKTAVDDELVTIAWPVLLAEDLQQLARLPKGRKTGAAARATWLQQRLVRIIEHGWQHPAGPVLLTVGDLAAMLNLGPSTVCELLTEARRTTGKALPTKGYYFDQGMRPTHKAEVIALYEQGQDEAAIAHRTNPAQTSVGRYLRDYERVKLLLKHRTPVERIAQAINMRPNVVRAYVNLIAQYHPELSQLQEAHSPS
jgi:hypothetical protein